VRVRGVERIEGSVFVVKAREGSEVKLTMADNRLFIEIVPGKMGDIRPGMFVGSAGTMQEDGAQKAIAVHLFPEAMSRTGEGHYDWDLPPKSKMTNGNVEHAVTSVDRPVLSVKYKDGEKKLSHRRPSVVTYEMRKREESQAAPSYLSVLPKSRTMALCKRRALLTAEMARGPLSRLKRMQWMTYVRLPVLF
jgi:hypothetical protein